MPLTLGAAVGVDRPYQDELRRRMRDIAQDVEEVELHVVGGMRRLHSARPAAWCRVRVSRCGAVHVRGSASSVSNTSVAVTSVAGRRVGAMQGMLLPLDDGVGGWVRGGATLVGDAIDSWQLMVHVLHACVELPTWQPCMTLARIAPGLHLSPQPGLSAILASPPLRSNESRSNCVVH